MHNAENINNLEVSIDWLGFTFFNYSSPYDIVAYLGFMENEFSVCNGRFGYKSALIHNLYPITILYDGNDNMGIHVDISGSGFAYALDSYVNSMREITPWGDSALEYREESYVICYLRHLNDCVKFTRLDLAIDDKGCNYYSVDDVRKICNDGRCASRFKKWNSMKESYIGGADVGNTVYIGKRSSDCFLRVYDKRLEQISKLDKDVGFNWVRWELELKKERSQRAVDYLLLDCSLGGVAIGILSNYFRVVVKDDSNITRCSTDPLWKKFVEGVEKLHLSLNKVIKSISKKKDWIIKQCLPTISAVCAAEYGDLSFIVDHLSDAFYRNSRSVLDLVFKENPDLIDALSV